MSFDGFLFVPSRSQNSARQRKEQNLRSGMIYYRATAGVTVAGPERCELLIADQQTGPFSVSLARLVDASFSRMQAWLTACVSYCLLRISLISLHPSFGNPLAAGAGRHWQPPS